jgi:hypothetical protein
MTCRPALHDSLCVAVTLVLWLLAADRLSSDCVREARLGSLLYPLFSFVAELLACNLAQSINLRLQHAHPVKCTRVLVVEPVHMGIALASLW